MKKLSIVYKDFFIAMYSEDGRNIYNFEDFEECSIFFNLEIKEIHRRIKEDKPLLFGKVLVKLYLIPKNKINENYKRRR